MAHGRPLEDSQLGFRVVLSPFRTLWLQPGLVRTVDAMGDVVPMSLELAAYPAAAKGRRNRE